MAADKILNVLKVFLKKYFLLLTLQVIGCFGGLTGFICGSVSGIFLTLIYRRILEEREIKNAVKESRAATSISEPFPGCIHLCAITYWCTQDARAAERYIGSVLSKKYSGDWRTLCEVASGSEVINVDLLTECLAVALRKASDSELLKMVFSILSAAEFSWNPEQGTKPSAYLSELLNYSFVSDDLKTAYHILGLEDTADLHEVKAAHRKLVSKYHPDKNHSTDGVMDFMKIQNAYELILSSIN